MRISDWSSDVCSSDLVSRLQRQILAGRDNSAFGESGARDRHILRQNLRRFSKDRQRQMMLAQDEAIGLQIVHRFDQMLLLAKSHIIRRAKLRPFPARRLQSRLFPEESEALAQHKLEFRSEQRVELARKGEGRMFAHSHNAAVARYRTKEGR